MAALVLGVAGAVVGSAFGMPQLGWTIGTTVGGFIDRANQPGAQGPRLNDKRVTGTAYGDAYPWVVGSPFIAGHIEWASEKHETANVTGGKGGGPENTSYSYDVDLLIVLTENALEGLGRIKYNGELVWNGMTTKEGVWTNITFHDGNPDQLPDPIYEAAVGVGNAPAYRGRASIMIEGLQLGTSGVIGNLTFEPGGTTPVLGPKRIFPWTHVDKVGDACVPSEYPVHGDCLHGPVECVVLGEGGGTFSSMGDAIASAGGEDIVCRGFYTSTQSLPSYCPGGATLDDDPEYVYAVFSPPGEFQVQSGSDPDEGLFACTWLASVGSEPGDGVIYTDPLTPLAFYTLVPNGGTMEGFPTIANHCINYPPVEGYFPTALSAQATVIQIKRLLTCDDGCTTATPTPGTVRQLIYGETYAAGVLATNGTGPVLRVGEPHFDDETWWVQQAAEAGIDLGSRTFQLAPGSETEAELKELYFGVFPPSVCQCSSDFEHVTSTVQEVVTELMLRAGYAESDFDASALAAITKPVRALVVGQVSSTRSVLEALKDVFFYESAGSDKIYLFPREVEPVCHIPFEDLGTSENASSDEEPLAITLGSDLEMPAQIFLSYPNMASEYEVDTQPSDRLLSGQESDQTIQSPVGMLPAEAKGVVDAILMDRVASLGRVTIALPLKYARLIPGCVVTTEDHTGRVYRLRLLVRRDSLSVLRFDCVVDNVEALTSAAITDEDYPTNDVVTQIAATDLIAGDFPLLHDGDNGPGWYAVVTPDREAPTDTWPGGAVLLSWNSVDYTQLLTTSQRCTTGVCTNVLGNFSGGNVFDEFNRLTVVVNGELAGSTRADMLLDSGVNALMVGVEAIRFRDRELLDADEEAGTFTYRLSGLLRGQLGTEWAMGSHGADEICVLLNSNLRRVTSQNDELNVPSYLKGVTLGLPLSSATAQNFTNTGVSQKPYSPARLRALRVGGDIELDWLRRTRFSCRYGGVSPTVPLGENTEAYRVRVFDGVALVRTVETSVPSMTYSAAEIAADGFTPGDPITFEVCQRSDMVGPGYPRITEGIAP